jgi:hypothetical protein
VTAADLDLDVVRRFGASQSELLDEDGFAEHRERFGYPADVVAAAEQAAAWLRRAVISDEPFQSAYRPWLSMVDGPDPDDVAVP